MNDIVKQGVLDAMQYLISLAEDKLQPEEAKLRLKALKERYAMLKIDLIWQEEAYDESIHYDLLLRSPDVGTISLSVAPKNSLPWPLRGVQRSREQDFLKVNNMIFTVGDTVARLDFLWNEKPLTDRFVTECLIYEALDEHPIDISDAELQEALNAFRTEHKLYRAQDTYRWIADRGITHEKLESLVLEHTKVAKLRERLTASRVSSYFEQHRTDFESVRVVQITFKNEASAIKAREQIASNILSFYDLLEQNFISTQASQIENSFKVIQRGQMPSEIEDRVFSALPGDILGPLEAETGYMLLRILSFQPACLDGTTTMKIQQSLFKEWLVERRAKATVEWNWG